MDALIAKGGIEISYFMDSTDLEAIDLDTIVERRTGMPCRVLIETGMAGIQFPGNTVAISYPIDEVFSFMTHRELFAVGELPNRIDNASKIILVRRLIAEGLLRIRYD